MQISGSRVLLTGASGGLGGAIARDLAARGAQLILTARRMEILAPLAAELGAQALAVDLADPAAAERLPAAAGEVDILIANAALPGAGALSSFSVAEIDRTIAVNLRAPIVLARLLAPEMARRERGHLLFMSSLSGKASSAGASLYNATKYGLRGFAGSLRAELRGSGVGVSAIFPGFISDAGMFAQSGVRLPAGVGTRTPRHVTRAVAGAIERNRGEVDVAPPLLRAGTLFAGVAPELAARLATLLGSHRVAAEYERGHAHRR